MTGKLTFVEFTLFSFSFYLLIDSLLSIQWAENDSLRLRVIDSNKIKVKNIQNNGIRDVERVVELMQITDFHINFMINYSLILYLFFRWMNNFNISSHFIGERIGLWFLISSVAMSLSYSMKLFVIRWRNWWNFQCILFSLFDVEHYKL